MANHGAVCYGEDVFKAYFRMETMEHLPRIQLVAELLAPESVSAARKWTSCSIPAPAMASSAQCRPSGLPVGRRGPPGGEERFYVTRSELIGLVDEAATGTRGMA